MQTIKIKTKFKTIRKVGISKELKDLIKSMKKHFKIHNFPLSYFVFFDFANQAQPILGYEFTQLLKKNGMKPFIRKCDLSYMIKKDKK